MQELGARRVSELRTLAAPRKRRVHDKRSHIRGAPTRPGVYLFRDRHDHVLYIGRARDLRTRLRSYFHGESQRPSVEAALLALNIHGDANRTVPRQRVIEAYLAFIRARPPMAGFVAQQLADWDYWDAATEYAALLKQINREPEAAELEAQARAIRAKAAAPAR